MDHHHHDHHDEHENLHGSAAHGHHGHHDHGDHAEQYRRLFWVSLILTIPVVLTSEMIQGWLNYSLPDFPGDTWVGPVLGTITFVYGGRVFLDGAVDELKLRQPGMMTLISLAISVAFVASWATTFGWLDLDFWWELALLVTIMLLGHWLEMRALGASQSALDALAELVPDEAERITEHGTEQIPVSQLQEGDIVLVRPGGRVPADGEIVDGEAEFDESMITGESRPVARAEGEKIIAGSVASGSSVRFRITARGEETELAGIQRMVAEAQSSKSSGQVLADRFAGLLFYIASGAAIVTFFIWWLAVGDLNDAITRAVTLLVISCPHALGLAIPLVVAITTEVGARNGVLIRDRTQLERFREVDTVIWDKTGTLTRGEHVVRGVMSIDGDDDALLARAAAVEMDSEHPLATAIVSAAQERTLDIPRAQEFIARAGRGVSARIDGSTWYVGGNRVLQESGARLPDAVISWQESWNAQGAAVLYVLEGDEVRGAIALADEVREESAPAVRELQEADVDSMILTGDAQVIAETVAAEIGIDSVQAEVLPEDKQRVVMQAQDDGKVVAMVGDGINDAPALAQADVGLAIGAGTDVAAQSAGIVLAGSDPRTVPGTRRLSQAMYRKMVQNLGWAAGYNLLAIPLAAGVLAPWGVILPPAAAAVLMSISTIVVALNAQTLRGFRFSK